MRDGTILFTCGYTHSVYAFSPASGDSKLIAGAGTGDGSGYANGSALCEAKFDTPTAIGVDERARCAIVVDASDKTVRRITLPPHYFAAPTNDAPTPAAAL